MCEYAEYNQNNQLICKPCKSLCLFCVMGNANRYKEIKEQEHKQNRGNIR